MTKGDIRKIKDDTEIDCMLNKLLKNETHPYDYVEVGVDKTCLPESYIKYHKKLKKFKVKSDDVYIISHPKTGTTWCQEMVWLISNNLNYQKAKSEYIIRRFPILEASIYMDPDRPKYNIWRNIDPLLLFGFMPSPRFFKSHLPWGLLPEQIQNGTKKPKIIGIIRKPHDVCVSYYYHLKKIGLNASLNEFGELFLAGRLVGGPYHKSILSVWEQRHRPNVLMLNFHDLKEDLKASIKKVAKFLDKSLTKEQIDQLSDYLGFENMKNNPSSNCLNLIRKGEVGGYKKEMSPELIRLFDEYEKEMFEGTGIVFQ